MRSIHLLSKTALLCVQICVGFSTPNFLIFLADDLGYGDIGCFGNHSISTPNIDRLAETGIKLTHHLTAAAVCTPSRAALLTGRYPNRYGMESSSRNKVFFFAAASGGLPETEITIAKALKEKNYNTAIIGKWHLGNDCNRSGDGCHHPLNHGFDYFYGLPLSNFKDLGETGESVITTYQPNFYSYLMLIPILGITLIVFNIKNHKFFSFILLILMIFLPLLIIAFTKSLYVLNGIIMENKTVVEQPIRLKGLTQRLVKKVNTFLEDQRSSHSPFFLYVPFVHVHTALFCADEFAGKSKHGAYGDNVEEMDWAVGEILKTLESLGLHNQTFVYFSSDNGAHLEEVGADGHQEGGYNGIFRGGKMMGGLEGGIRVPSIISWPGVYSKSEVSYTTSQMDLYPTIMDIAGIKLPTDRIIDGRSLTSVLQGGSKQPHQFLFHYCGKEIHAATYVQPEAQKVWKLHWITPKFLPGTSRCEYVCHCFGDFVVHHDPPLLYDLESDPSESQPLALNAATADFISIVSTIEKARNEHYKTLKDVPDQYSFSNSIWKPWLQPCCNFPRCNCRDESFQS